MSIFDDIHRSDQNPPCEREAAFAYLNRSDRIEAGRVRRLVDLWIDHYPAQHREALVARFRSTINDHHISAFFELFLHELVLRCGHRVVSIEPRLTHVRNSPDFLIESKHGCRFYLDGVLATGRSQQETVTRARLNQALAAIDATPSPAHFLDLEVTGCPTAPMTIWRMKRGLRIWLARLPEGESAADASPFRYEEHGARIVIRAWPRRSPQEISRSTGVSHFRAMTITPDENIRAALKKKAFRYGILDHPYVVAVNAFGDFQLEGNVVDALFGSQRIPSRQLSGARLSVEEGRCSDGIWIGPRGPRNAKLSAVIAMQGIDPWNFAQRNARLIRNPWAARQLPPIGLGIGELSRVGPKLRRKRGSSMASILGVAQRWPDSD
jgi:hypothetical protein